MLFLKRSESNLATYRVAALASTAVLTGCGAGGSSENIVEANISPTSQSQARISTSAIKPTSIEASRFLTQASFGANDADIASITSSSYTAWIDRQMALPPKSHLAYMDARLAALKAQGVKKTTGQAQFYESFWQQAATGDDQLRQRIKLALSEIFVTSFSNDDQNGRTMGSYYDMLGRDAFGNFRNLLQDVSLHPAMGVYLTYIGNQKEDDKTGRNPDENYAREIMQLMTIGLYELNLDGTVKNDVFGNPIPTYSPDDIKGLAKVFTGLSWYAPIPSSNTFHGGKLDDDGYVKSMILYNSYHSTSAKSFLKANIPSSSIANGAADLNFALDVLFNHPNVAPFISKQLIQRLITSNPTGAYVRRVATIFNNNGSGVRGDMASVVKAILLDDEARQVPTSMDYGKLREPLVRLANWMRSFEVTSKSGNWLMGTTSDQTQLSQTALYSPSVFNFFRPGYSPPNTVMGGKGKVAPEFQITNEITTAAYINYMQNAIARGVGAGYELKSAYAKEVALAETPAALVDRISLLLGINMSATLRSKIVSAVGSVAIPSPSSKKGNVASQIVEAKLNRVWLAILLSMASPEYIIQR